MHHTAIFTLQKTAKKLAVRAVSLLIGTVLVLGLMQPAAQAAPAGMMDEGVNTLTEESLSQKRAERRAINSQAAQAANDEETQEKGGSLGEVLNEKLNLDEIVEENVIVDDARDALDLDAPREIPRRGR